MAGCIKYPMKWSVDYLRNNCLMRRFVHLQQDTCDRKKTMLYNVIVSGLAICFMAITYEGDQITVLPKGEKKRRWERSSIDNTS